jgi:hypothetical protein
MRLLTAALALSCFCPAGPEKDTGPVVVDFSPLVGTKDVTLELSMRFEGVAGVRGMKLKSTGGTDDLKQAVSDVNSYATLLNPPFDVEAVKGEPKLIIKGYKGKGVLEVRCVAVGFPCENQPKISRLKEKK